MKFHYCNQTKYRSSDRIFIWWVLRFCAFIKDNQNNWYFKVLEFSSCMKNTSFYTLMGFMDPKIPKLIEPLIYRPLDILTDKLNPKCVGWSVLIHRISRVLESSFAVEGTTSLFSFGHFKVFQSTQEIESCGFCWVDNFNPLF